MLFKLKQGTPVFIGNLPLALPGDIEFEIPGKHDDVARILVQAGQKIYGDHVGALTHEETVKRDSKDVKVSVTYGPGRARIETKVPAQTEE